MEKSDLQNLEVNACNEDIFRQPNLTKLETSSTQKMNIGALLQQLPEMTKTDSGSSAYSIKIPAGVSLDNLAHFANDILGGILKLDNGNISGYLALLGGQAILNAFSSMVIASRQYYLSEINDNLKAINQKVDKILEFLYGDKKAELMAEVRFVNFAYQNYISIMENNTQRVATLVNVQDSRKVAMKDIEFYGADLDSMAKAKNIPDLEAFMNKAFRIKECLQLAIQLYCMSNILEVYYSQNSDQAYLKYVENDIFTYIDKCEKRMLADFSAIQLMVDSYKGNPLKKIDKTEFKDHISGLVDLLGSGEELIKRKPLQLTLQSYQKGSTYYLSKEGDVYLQTA